MARYLGDADVGLEVGLAVAVTLATRMWYVENRTKEVVNIGYLGARVGTRVGIYVGDDVEGALEGEKEGVEVGPYVPPIVTLRTLLSTMYTLPRRIMPNKVEFGRM